MRRKAYRSVPVKGVDVAVAVSRLPEGRLVAGIDVGKTELLVVLRGEDGTMLRPWSAWQPRELPAGVALAKCGVPLALPALPV